MYLYSISFISSYHITGILLRRDFVIICPAPSDTSIYSSLLFRLRINIEEIENILYKLLSWEVCSAKVVVGYQGETQIY
jgi:hypothetical protein